MALRFGISGKKSDAAFTVLVVLTAKPAPVNARVVADVVAMLPTKLNSIPQLSYKYPKAQAALLHGAPFAVCSYKRPPVLTMNRWS